MSRFGPGRVIMLLAALALLTAGLTSVASASAPTAPVRAAAEQTLTWKGGNSTTAYAAAPTEAVSGPATIVFQNNADSGNTSGMQHTLTFATDDPDYNSDVDVNIVAYPEDENGGLWEVEVDLTPGTYLYHCTIPGHGQMTGTLEVADGGGDPGEDTDPPEVSASIAGDQEAGGGYVGKATATVEATDEGSGVDTIEYQVDDTGWTTYEEPVVIDEPGDHTFGYRATDKAGNTSAEATEQVSIVAEDGPDTTPPEVEAHLMGETNAAGEYLGRAELMVMAEDSQSGVASVQYALDGGEWQDYTETVVVEEVGAHTATYRASDEAGNVSATKTLDFTVAQAPDDDQDPPTVNVSLAGNQDSSWVYTGTVTVTLAASDEGSGVDTVEYRLDDGEWTAYADPIEVDEPGEHAIGYRATDLGGNASEEATVGFTVADPGDAPTCASPDPSPVVVVGTVGTAVRNRTVGDGCTVDDAIRDEARWADHKQFVAHVQAVTDDLLEDGWVTAAEQRQILAAARQSDVGRGV